MNQSNQSQQTQQSQHHVSTSAPPQGFPQGGGQKDDGGHHLSTSIASESNPFGQMLDVAGLAHDQALASKLLERVQHKEISQPRIPVDVVELNDALVIRVDVAGVEKKDLGITVDQHHVYISVKRCSDEGSSGAPPLYHLQELNSGSSSRCIKVGSKYSTNDVVASLNHGMLMLRFPRLGQTPERRHVQLT
jgi:HSP20 family molecular chaperone IbpA